MRAQMALWALEERQRRCLEKLVSDVTRLSVPPASLALLLRFLCRQDLALLASITGHLLRSSAPATESVLQRLSDAVQQALKARSLRHCSKLAILIAARWRHSALSTLPLPDSLKRYLVDSHC